VRVEEAFVQRNARFSAGKTVLRVILERTEDPGPPTFAPATFGPARGDSPAMRQVFGVLSRVARTDASVVLLGETGTGKSLLAKALHLASPRRAKPFVVFDCAAVKASLFESELFGHVRGAFTGAASDRAGLLGQVGAGTLFLDEIGELPLELQTKLLRLLETGRYQRLGEDVPRQSDARVVAATHRDLEHEVAQGRFREDLYFRLAVVVVTVPPLRERLADIPALAQHFLKELGHPAFDLPPALLDQLGAHGWPGNLRELRNTVERALVGVHATPRPPPTRGASAAHLKHLPYRKAKEQLVDAFTRDYLAALLERCDHNITAAARTAGIARAWVHKLVKKYGLQGR